MINSNQESLFSKPQTLSSILKHKRKNRFFAKRYLEFVSGPTPRIKAALRRKLITLPKGKKPTVPSFLLSSQSHLIWKNLCTNILRQRDAKLKQQLLRNSHKIQLTQPTTRNYIPKNFSNWKFLPQNATTQKRSSAQPLNFSKPYMLPYLQSKYKTFEFVLDPVRLTSHKPVTTQLPFDSPMFNSLTKIVGNLWFVRWQLITRLYTTLNTVPQSELYLRARQWSQYDAKHCLQFKFKGSKLFVNLLDFKHQLTHISLNTGLLIRYFQNKKSLKKNKSMKLLMIKFLRKILLILRLKNIIVLSRGVPVHFSLLLATLFRPLAHPFVDPLTGTTVDETQGSKGIINMSALFFLTSKPFGTQKTKKKGRVKRKIRRKLVRSNSIID